MGIISFFINSRASLGGEQSSLSFNPIRSHTVSSSCTIKTDHKALVPYAKSHSQCPVWSLLSKSNFAR